MKKINWVIVALIAIIALFVICLPKDSQAYAISALITGWVLYNMLKH